jgi:hypothetical protein
MKNPFVFTVNERNAATSNKTKKCDSPSREARVLFISTQLNLLPFRYSSYGCVHRRKQFCACVAMMRARAGAGDRCLQPYATSSSWVSTIEKCDRAINFSTRFNRWSRGSRFEDARHAVQLLQHKGIVDAAVVEHIKAISPTFTSSGR